MTTLHVVLTTEKRDLPAGVVAGALQAQLKDSTGAVLQTITPDESGSFDFPGVADSQGAVTIEVARLDSTGAVIGTAISQSYTVTPAGGSTGVQFDAPVSMVVSQV